MLNLENQNDKAALPKNKGAKGSDSVNRVLTVIGSIMCIILIPILIVNCTLIIKSFINKDEVPSFGGVLPLIVLTDSMYPDIKSGDLIICKEIDPKEIEVGDVISFYDPAGNGTAVVTHKVIDILEEDGKRSFRTKGINNNTEDKLPVSADKVIAEYSGIRIPAAGNVAIFMQTTAGLIICVIVPIVLFVGYDILRRRKYEKTKGDDLEALMAELEALKAANAAKTQETAPAESVEPVKPAEPVEPVEPVEAAEPVEAPVAVEEPTAVEEVVSAEPPEEPVKVESERSDVPEE